MTAASTTIVRWRLNGDHRLAAQRLGHCSNLYSLHSCHLKVDSMPHCAIGGFSVAGGDSTHVGP